MKIEFEASKVLDVVAAAAAVAPDRDPRPVLRHVLITARADGATEWTASSGGLALRGALGPGSVVVAEPGSVLCNAKRFASVIKENKNSTIKLTADGKTAKIQIGGSRAFSLAVEDPNDYPPITGVANGAPKCVVTNEQLRAVVRHVEHSAHDEESKRLLHGVCLQFRNQALRFVASDGLSMSIVDIPLATPVPDAEAVVHADSALKMLLAANAKDTTAQMIVAIDQTKVSVTGPLGQVLLGRLNGNYPPYERGIPTKPLHLLPFKRATLLALLKQAALLKSTGMTLTLQLLLDADLSTWTLKTGSDCFQESLPIVWPHPPLVVLLHPLHLHDCLQTMTAEDVTMEITSPMHPVLLREHLTGMSSYAAFSPIRP